MAGNLVKWWKHKILGGYKQFSVQECTTDSEELMYHQVRASSSCSAPPDLLLVSDRENNIPLRSPVVNIIGNTTTTSATNNTAPATTTTSPSSANACHITTTTSASNNNQKHNQKLHSHHQHHHHVTAATTTTTQHQQQQQLSLAYNGTKDIGNVKSKSVIGNSNNSTSKLHQQQLSLQDCQQTVTAHDIEGQLENQTNNHSSTRHAQHHHTQHNHHHHQQQQQRPEEHIRLEEFTCDVSVEGGKSSQPLQFSFTFYDLDGHHGKITKDDIVGIVYTIYESIGKSVVVPHSGSKTINVRLTVSPEGKSKSNKTKKNANSSALALDAQQKSAPLTTNAAAQAAARRLHRYRPRKLIKSDEEDDDSNSDKERDNSALNHNSSNLSHVLAHSKSSSATKSHKLSKLKAEHHCCAPTPNTTLPVNNVDLPNSPLDTIYDNLKAANNTTATTPEACRECLAAVDESRNLALSPTAVQYPAHKTSNTNEAYMKHVASTRIKMLRKSRKQKHQDCLETRQRSLSVGNETCWKNRHLQKQQNAQQQLLWQAEQQLNQSANVGAGSVIMDGVQLRNPLKNGALKSSTSAAQKRNSAECWKTALNRNDLISIIRESMEKNRLCFQLNGKPQANVSPIRHSQTPTQQQQQPIPPHHQQHLLLNQHNNISSISNNKHSQHQTSTTPTTSTQRQRSNTVSKIPTLIANHSSTHSAQHYHANNSSSAQHHHHRSSSCANTINNNNTNSSNQQHLQQHDLSLHDTPNITNSSNSNNVYHQHQHLPQPHIPIYHQQMAINPAIIAAHNNLLHSASNSTSAAAGTAASSGGHHSKMNLCGYDSFLHATICGGGLSHSPPAHSNHNTSNAIASPLTTAVTSSGHQQIATVQPIMSSQSHAAAKHQLSLAVTPTNQIKTSKILRSGSYAAQTQQQHHPNTTQNSPQYHGYQRLPSSSKHNLAALHLVSPSMEKPPLDQLDKWRRDQVKNYDQLLYAKLSEKLQQTQLVASSSSHTRESHQRRKHRILKQRRANNLIQEANNVPTLLANKLCVREDSDYATLIPIEGDAVECENLLGQSSDEENLTPAESSSPLTSEEKPREQQLNSNSNSSSRHVAEGTLVDLDDVDVEEELEDETDLQTSLKLNQLPLNADSLLRVEEDEVHDLHLANGLDIDDVLADDLADDLADVVAGIAQTQSGRNSAASNEDVDSLNGVGATLANTTNSGANTSTTSSSLIHRYVHEHIHHHYHHFEEKEE